MEYPLRFDSPIKGCVKTWANCGTGLILRAFAPSKLFLPLPNTATKFIMILCVEQQFNPGETSTVSFIYCAHSFSVLFYRGTILKCYVFPYYTFFGKVGKTLKPGLTKLFLSKGIKVSICRLKWNFCRMSIVRSVFY